MADKPIHTPVVVVDPNGDVSVHDTVTALEATLRPLGAAATDQDVYDVLGDRLTVEVDEVAKRTETEPGPERPTRRGLFLGRLAALQAQHETETVVSVRKPADAPPAGPWVRAAIAGALADAGVEEAALEDPSFRELTELARRHL